MLVKTKKGEGKPHQSLACGVIDRRQTILQYLGHRIRLSLKQPVENKISNCQFSSLMAFRSPKCELFHEM